MKIRDVKKTELKEYIQLRRQDEKDYSKIIGRRVKFPPDFILKKEVLESVKKGKKSYIFVAEENGCLVGYIYGKLYGYPANFHGYIEDIFVLKNFRKKGIGKQLIKEFIKALKKRKIKSIRLSVDIKNKIAIDFYKKLNFKLEHYELEKDIK